MLFFSHVGLPIACQTEGKEIGLCWRREGTVYIHEDVFHLRLARYLLALIGKCTKKFVPSSSIVRFRSPRSFSKCEGLFLVHIRSQNRRIMNRSRKVTKGERKRKKKKGPYLFLVVQGPNLADDDGNVLSFEICPPVEAVVSIRRKPHCLLALKVVSRNTNGVESTFSHKY